MVTNEQLYLMIMVPIAFNATFTALLIFVMNAKDRRRERQSIKDRLT